MAVPVLPLVLGAGALFALFGGKSSGSSDSQAQRYGNRTPTVTRGPLVPDTKVVTQPPAKPGPVTQRDNQDGAGKGGAGKAGAGKAGAGKGGAGKADDEKSESEKVQEGIQNFNAVMDTLTNSFNAVSGMFSGGGE